MALEVIEHQAPPAGRALARVLEELQGLKCNVLAGAAAETNIALAGIGIDDTILAALLYRDPASAATAAVVKLTPSANGAGGGIPIAGNVRFVEATNASANDRIVVWWFDKQAL